MKSPNDQGYRGRDRFGKSDRRGIFDSDNRPDYRNVCRKDIDLRGIRILERTHMLTTLCLLHDNPIMKMDYYTFVDRNGKKRLEILEYLELIEYRTVGKANRIHLTEKGAMFARYLMGLNDIILSKDGELNDGEIDLETMETRLAKRPEDGRDAPDRQ